MMKGWTWIKMARKGKGLVFFLLLFFFFLEWRLKNILPGWSGRCLGIWNIRRVFSCGFVCLFVDCFREGHPPPPCLPASQILRALIGKSYLSVQWALERGVTSSRADYCFCSRRPSALSSHLQTPNELGLADLFWFPELFYPSGCRVGPQGWSYLPVSKMDKDRE